MLRPLVNERFQGLFHSPPGVLFTFPSQYWYTIGLPFIFSLTGWSPQIPTGFLVSRRTQVRPAWCSDFAYGAFTLSGRPSQTVPLSSHILARFRAPYNPVHVSTHGLGSSPFARRYWGNLV